MRYKTIMVTTVLGAFVAAGIIVSGKVTVRFLIAALLVLAISVHVANWRSLNVNAAHALLVGDRKIRLRETAEQPDLGYLQDRIAH